MDNQSMESLEGQLFAAARDGENGDGVLHLMAKRGNTAAVRWLLDRGADPDKLWNHWGALLTPLHLAVLSDHVDVAAALLDAGADAAIRDSLHNSDARGWATFFRRQEIVDLIDRSRRA